MRRLVWTVVFLFTSSIVNAASLKVAVATNFKPVLAELAESYRQQTGIRIKISAASTGVLYAQIRHGAPFDVFLAADSIRPVQLEQQGRVIDGTRKTYAMGQLAMWIAKSVADQNPRSFEAVLKQWQGRISIANPKLAPYGSAAQAVLSHYEMWPYESLVKGNSVAQTFQFVLSKNVKLGFVAHSQLLAHDVSNQQFWLIPQEFYPKLEQQLVVLKSGKQRQLALAFVDWVMSEKTQQFIVAKGYGVI